MISASCKEKQFNWGLFHGVVVGYDHQMAQYKRNNNHDTTQKRINNGFHNTKKHLMIGMKDEYIWWILFMMEREEVCVSEGMDKRHDFCIRKFMCLRSGTHSWMNQ